MEPVDSFSFVKGRFTRGSGSPEDRPATPRQVECPNRHKSMVFSCFS